MNDSIAIASDRASSGMPRPILILLVGDRPWLAPDLNRPVVVDVRISKVAIVASVGVEAVVLNDKGKDDR